MKFEKLGPHRSTVRVPHSWHAAFASALAESDPMKLIERIEYAINTIKRRYSEWETHPGTPAELTAIRKCIDTRQCRLRQNQLGRIAKEDHSMVEPAEQMIARLEEERLRKRPPLTRDAGDCSH